MTQHRPSLIRRTAARLGQLWKRRRELDRRRARRQAFLFEPLESRHLMASDPTLAALPNIVLNGGSPQWVPLDGFDDDGGTLVFTATSSNPSLVTPTIPTGNSSLKMTVASFGDMYFQLFEHLTPRVTSRIKQLVESGFYDDTATNTITFHRILNDFVIQAGDPTGTGSGGSTLGDFDDQFHADLQHNRSGLLSMAKTTDDTNDSQFFITEERNESQFITLTGNPTGGTFTLTYFDQVTPAITFSNSANFTTIASSIQAALEGLTRIGAGNVVVTHDPARNQQGQITENRRWKVEFTGALAHQEVVNLTAADNLTGGTSPAVSITEQKSARHLDFNHSIFGILTQGESVRDAISNVTTNSSGTPANPPVISGIDVIVDPENGAMLLKAAEGASGEAEITVRITDPEGNFTERTFHVVVAPDAINGAPFLGEIGQIRATVGQQVQIPLTATDVEGQAFLFAAAKPSGNAVNYTITNVNAQGEINDGTSVVKINAPAGFVGTFNVLVGVRASAATDTGDTFDTQVVAVTVAPAAPTSIDLVAASDTGFSNTDNITNASSLNFTIAGVTSGAVVKLKRGDEVLAQGTAAGTSITLNIPSSATLGDGTHSLRATQTVSSIESDLSATLALTIDTTPPAEFTSTPPTEATVALPLEYDSAAPGEGTAGFVYSLTSAPVGAIINGVSGLVNWTPAANQVGNHVFQVVATDPAGNTRQQTLNITVDEGVPAKIDVTLTLTRPDGSPLTSLNTNQDFVLHMFVEDFRNEHQFIRLDGGPTGGTFTLTFGTETTAPIAFDNAGDFTALAASIRTALEALAGIAPGDIVVTHDPQRNASNEITENRRWKVEFTGALAHQEVTNLTGNAAGLTGGSGHAVSIQESLEPAGVASVYVDILFDPAKAEVTGPITYGTLYQLFKSGSTAIPGLIDELGAFGQISGPIGPGKFEMASIPMKARQAGLLSFTTNPTDDPAARPAGVYLENEEVPFEEIRFGTTSIMINQAALTFQAVNDTVNVNEDAQNQTLNPLSNDTINQGSGNVLTIQSFGQTSNGGTVQITQNGTRLSYTPASNFFGTETFSYTVQNQNGDTSTATITVQVQPQNDAPTAVDDTFNVPEDSQQFALDVLANDQITPDANETKKVSAVTQPASGGTVAVGPNGNSVTFNAANNFLGKVTYSYTLSDGNGGTDTATVTLTVTESNDNPIAGNDTTTVGEDSTGNVINVLANDTFAPDTNETLSVTGVTTGSNGGSITLGQNGANVVYTPAANFQGTETFSYTLSDGNGGTATGIVTVTVTNANNDPPTANNDTLNAFKNAPNVLDVLANDTSAPDPTEALTIDSVTQPAHGTVAITNNGTRVTYTPTTDYTGPDSFTYVIKDPTGALSQTATVNLTVLEFIPSSLAGFVYFDVDNDGVKDPRELAISGVTITLTGTDFNSAAVNQTLKTGADGSYKFDGLAPGNYTISQTQPAFVLDGKEKVGSQGGTSTQNDKIVIANLVQNTTGVDNNFGERGRQSSLITLRDFFSRSSRHNVTAALDSAGAMLWQSVKGNPFQGFTNPLVSLVNNQIKVEGTNGSSQPVAANLPLSDTRVRMLGTSGTSKLFQIASFNLANPTNNTPPTAVNDSFTATEDTALNVAVANGVLKNDTDPNATQQLSAVVVTQPDHGTLTLNANGSFLYTPTANYSGPDSFTYRASDGIAQSAPATVNITVTAVNDAPVAADNSHNATQDTALNVDQATGVLANDTDAEGTALTATIVAQPQHGTVTLNANGSFVYTPTTGYTGPDSFTYRASDGPAQSAPATVNITVAATGGGEGEAEGEGGSQSAAAAALLAFLASQDDDESDSLLGPSADWAAAVDQALS
jgi:VCBS repeat-containing protein